MINTIDIISKQDLYREELQDPRWKAKRAIILARDQYKCTACHSTINLHCHHMLYIEGVKPWDYPDEIFKTLCDKCHTQFHETHDSVWMYRISHLQQPKREPHPDDPLE